MDNKGIYIHIPFCTKKCNYCDFYLITNPAIIEGFINSILAEIQISSELYKNDFFDSIFIGGGTPSLLPCEKINKILIKLKEHFNISVNCEISIETNPEDFINSPDKLRIFSEIGINRLSIGVQSFNNHELRFLSREHNSDEAELVLSEAKKYFSNISIDIIYSLPKQTSGDLLRTLEKSINLGLPHLSAYTLIYEPETNLFKELNMNNFEKNSDIVESNLYDTFNNVLRNSGYEHYEISNYCKTGFKSVHNLKYWEYDNYIGFGPSSHSFYKQKRWNNVRNIIKYINNLNKGKLPIENVKELSKEESLLEFIMLGLRAEGINIGKFQKLFNIDFKKRYNNSLETLIEKKYGFFEEDRFRLTEKGYALADEIVSRYF
jgi:oxygen-independent coproporphyrinogen III oxidase